MNTPCRRLIQAFALGTAGVLAGCNTTNENSVDKVRVTPETLESWLKKDPDKYLIVDARPKESYLKSRLRGAIQLNPGDVDPQDPDPKFDEYSALIVYGEDPAFGRANALTKRLIEAGIDVYMLDGGLKAWRESGFPVESPDTK